MTALTIIYDRREWLLELLLLVAESMLIWMIATLVFGPFASHRDPVPLLLVLGMVVTAGILPQLLRERGIWGRSFSTSITIAIIGSTSIAIKVIAFPGLPWFDSLWIHETEQSLVFEASGADIVVWAPIGLSAAIWWLGRLHGTPGLERSRETLRIGAVLAAGVTLSAGMIESSPPARTISLAIIVFFISTLIALAVARQGREVTRSRRRAGSTVILPALAIGAVATASALLVTFDWERALPNSLPSIGAVLDPVFAVLTLLLTAVVFIIALPLLWLLSLGNYESPRVMEFAGFDQGNATQSAFGWHPPDPVRYLLAGLALVAIFYGVARFGYAIVRRDPIRTETGDRRFGHGTGFDKWLDRFRWSLTRGRSDPLAGLRGDPAWEHTVRVREIYASWLRWAEKRRNPRNAGETALEFETRGRSFLQSSSAIDALDELTSIYDNVRYADVPASAEQASRAASAWQRLKRGEAEAGHTR